MWETSRFRGKNNNNNGGGRGGGNGGSGGRRGRAYSRMKRVQAELLATFGYGVPSIQVAARLVLNDLSPQSVTVFSVRPLELGQLVTFSIEHPRPLQVRGKITYCALYSLSERIHGTQRYSYRLQVEFDFLNDGEASAVMEYIEELARTDLAPEGRKAA